MYQDRSVILANLRVANKALDEASQWAMSQPESHRCSGPQKPFRSKVTTEPRIQEALDTLECALECDPPEQVRSRINAGVAVLSRALSEVVETRRPVQGRPIPELPFAGGRRVPTG